MTAGGEAALGAASAARQLVAAMLQDAGAIPYIRERLNLGMVVLPEMQQAIKAIYDCAARGQPANATTLSPLVGGKSLQPGDAGPGPKRRYPPDPPGY